MYEKRILLAVVEGGRMAEGLGGVTKEGGTARGRRGDEKRCKIVKLLLGGGRIHSRQTLKAV